jgi:hypothetical protein
LQTVSRIIKGFFVRVSVKPIFAMLFIFAASSAGEENISGIASIDYLEGAARVRKAGSEGWLKIGESAIISAGDSVMTLADSRAEIRLADSYIIRIGSSTIIGIADTTDVTLASGEIWTTIKQIDQFPGMRIESPVLVAEIEEAIARFSVGKDGSTEIKVYDGQIRLSILPVVAEPDSASSDSISYETADMPEITAPESKILLETNQKIIVTSVGEVVFHGDFDRHDLDEDIEWVRWNIDRDKGR